MGLHQAAEEVEQKHLQASGPTLGPLYHALENALRCFREILNRLHVCCLDGEVAYEHFLTNEDADDLVHRLAVAARPEERRRQRLAEAKPLPEDLEPAPQV